MKTKYVNFAALMVLAMIILTPSVSQGQTRFGIRGGLNAANISFDNLPNRGERYGFHLGIFTEVPLVTDFMSIQPELSYSVKGTNYKPASVNQKLNMNYVDLLLPVAFKLSSIDVQVGPFASYLISTPDYTYYKDNTIVVDAFKKFDAGLTAGLSYNFSRMIIGLRYNQGFMDVTKDKARVLLGSGKNAVGQVSLGYKF